MDMKYFPKKRDGSGYTPQETLQKLEEVLVGFDDRLTELDDRYNEILNELKEISSTKFGRRMGDDISVYCKDCKGHHTIPYIPGKYRICDDAVFDKSNYVIVKEDGTIEYERDELFP